MPVTVFSDILLPQSSCSLGWHLAFERTCSQVLLSSLISGMFSLHSSKAFAKLLLFIFWSCIWLQIVHRPQAWCKWWLLEIGLLPAIFELNSTVSDRDFALFTFKQWLVTNLHFNCLLVASNAFYSYKLSKFLSYFDLAPTTNRVPSRPSRHIQVKRQANSYALQC